MVVFWMGLLGCQNKSADVRVPPEPPPSEIPPSVATASPTPPPTTVEPLSGFIGSPCTDDTDCPYAGATCLTEEEGFPSGMCSASCDAFCDDATGFPTTFCSTIEALPPGADRLGEGGCSSRCDFEAYPTTGCRSDYGCVPTVRANAPDAITYACQPHAEPQLSSCVQDLAGRGLPFTTSLIVDRSPNDHPELICHVEEPVVFHSGYRGVDLVASSGQVGGVSGSCTFAHALADTIEDLEPDGVVAIHHLGSVACRVIAGTDTLSRHSFGDALDIAGFDFDDGSTLTLFDDWEHDTTEFETDGGAYLWNVSQDWHDQQLWNIILTPNYNGAHDNHYHVDLTPGSDFLGRHGDLFPLLAEDRLAD